MNLFLSKQVDAFTIAFQPGGFFSLFRIPVDELTNLDFSADAVLGKDIDILYDRLASVRSFDERVRVADQFFLTRSGAQGRMGKIAATIHHARGTVRVDDLAARAGLGPRQFERRFRTEIGIAPKLYARIVRFESALALKAVAPDLNWTQNAYDLGYYDQMHMVHDFQSLSGEPPGQISGRVDMFVLPEVNSFGAGDKFARRES